MYGTSSKDAKRDKGAKLIIVIKIKINISTILASASAGEWNLKKTIDQQKFKPSCKPKTIIALFFWYGRALLFHISQNDTPIKKYSAIHTGPKIYDGGFHEGLYKLSNHASIPFPDNRLLAIPASSHTDTDIINFQTEGMLFPFITIE